MFKKIISQKFVRNVGILTIANLISMVISLIQGFIVAKILGPSAYGIASLVMSYPNLVFNFFDAKSEQASVKYMSDFQVTEDHRKLLAMSNLGYIIDLIIAVLAFVTISVTANWAANNIIHQVEMGGLIIAYSFTFLFKALIGTSKAFFITLNDFNKIAYLEIVNTIIRTGLILSLLMNDQGVKSVILGNGIANIVIGLIYGILGGLQLKQVCGSFSWEGKFKALKGKYKEILSFVGFNNWSILVGILAKQIDLILLGFFRNETEVGYYAISKKIASLLNYLVSSLQSVIYPKLSKLWSTSGKKAVQNEVKKLVLKVGLPLGSLLLIMTLSVPLIINLLLGNKYQESIITTQFLLAGNAIWLIVFWLRPLYFSIGQVKEWSLGITIYSFIYTPLIIIVISNYGYIGLSIFQCVAVTIFNSIMWLLINKNTFKLTIKE